MKTRFIPLHPFVAGVALLSLMVAATPLRLAAQIHAEAATVPAAPDHTPSLAQTSETYDFIRQWGSFGSANGQFYGPQSVAVDASGNVFVVDTYNHRIQKFTNTGSFITTWGSFGSANGQLAYPWGVAVDASGIVFVADTGNNRVQKFTNTGSFIAAWGSSGSGNGQFASPWTVGVDASDNVFVADYNNQRIQKFTNTGSYITLWGSYGAGNGQFNGPTSVAVDTSSNVYVADQWNSRIQKFTNTGSFITVWGSYGTGNGQFIYPQGVAVDASGNVFVADSRNHRIEKFDNTGSFITTWGSYGTGNGQFVHPYGLAVDASGKVFVADTDNNRIQEFQPIMPRSDPNLSTLTVQPASVLANGVASSTLNIQLLGSSGQPAWGKTVRFYSDRGASDIITQPSSVTDQDGRTTGAIQSTSDGNSTISAVVFDDGVALSQVANVSFQPFTPPSSAFLIKIDYLVTQDAASLSDIQNDARAIADYGTYFRYAIAQDTATLGAHVVFNMSDVIGGLNDQYALQKSWRLACPGCYIPGTWNTQFLAGHPAATRLLDASFTKLLDAPAPKLAEFVGWGGLKYFGASYLNSQVENFTTDAAKNAASSIFSLIPDGMNTIAYPAIRDGASDLQFLVAQQRQSLLANLPAMSSSYQRDYESDLTGRTKALGLLRQQLYHDRITLYNFQQARAQHPNETLDWFLRALAKGLAESVFDGPGKVAVGGTLTLFDGYMDAAQLDDSVQMHTRAMSALAGAPNALQQTYLVASKALDRIALGLPANRVTGQINSVTHVSKGYWFGPKWVELNSWTDVSLTNTSNSVATFRVTSNYLADTSRFWVPWATYDAVSESPAILLPGDTASVRVPYKYADGARGLSPRGGQCLILVGCVQPSSIDIEVLGTNDAGTYFVANNTGTTWQPTKVTMTGQLARPSKADAGTTATIDAPLIGFVQSAPWLQKHEAQLWISNPFTTSIAVTVTQPLPNGIALLDIGGAVQGGSTLTWTRTISASALTPVTFTFAFSATPGVTNTLPAGKIAMVSPEDGQLLTDSSLPAIFQALWPLTLDHSLTEFVLPGSAPTAIITVTNWLTNSSLSGTLVLSATDSMSTTVSQQSQPFVTGPSANAPVTFTLPVTLPVGNYAVNTLVTTSGASTQAFVGLLQIGLPGPALDYSSTPLGLVHPGSTLTYTVRFTNTLGVPLSGAVLTASLPLSTTIMPGSITGGGVVDGPQIRWGPGTISNGGTVSQSFQVQVNTGTSWPWQDSARLLSVPRLTGNEIAPVWGPLAWNAVWVPPPYYLPVLLK